MIAIINFRYLSQGLSMKALAQEFIIGLSTTSLIINEVCNAIIQSLNGAFLSLPKRNDWLTSERKFAELGFPHAIAAIDGKHFEIKVIFIKCY